MIDVKKASVSVVIPCYKCSLTIARAVKSVAEQTVLPEEVILVDDFSNDTTGEVLYSLRSEYGEDWIKVIFLEENHGPGTARNIGWEVSKQEYIAFLDSDDTWHPQKIEIQYGWMISNPDVILTAHDFTQLNDNNENLSSYHLQQPCFYPVKKVKLLYSNQFSTITVMLKRNVIHRFAHGKKFSEDYLLWLEIICSDLYCYKLDWKLAYIHKAEYGEAGLSSNLWRMQTGEIYNYNKLFKCGNINFVQLIFFQLVSWAKFFKRLVNVYIK